MSFRKFILLLVLLLLLLYCLSPRRSFIISKEKNVVELGFFHPGGPIAGALEDVVKEFEKRSLEEHRRDPSKPVYRILAGQHGSPDQTADPTRFMISVAGGMPPDVIYFDRFAVAEIASRGAFCSLDDFIAKDLAANHPDAIRPERFYKAAWNEGLYKGKVYAIPNWVDCRALIFNKDLFRRAGIVNERGEPTPPKTWAELRSYAKKLTQYDEKGDIKVLGFAPNFGNSWFYFFAWMNDAEFMSEDGAKCTLNAPNAVEALQFIVNMYNDCGGYEQILRFQTSFQGGALDPLLLGKVAMKLDGYWALQGYAQFGRDVDYGVAPPPVSPRLLAKGKKTVSWSGGFSYAIPTTARHKEAAWEFLRFLVSERAYEINTDFDREWAESQGRLFLPTTNPMIDMNEKNMEKYVTNNPRIPQRIKDGCRVFMDLLPESRYRPVTPVGLLLWNRHVIAMEEACYMQKTPKEALDYGTAIVQRDLDKILNPPRGRPINWTLFFITYGMLSAILLGGAFLWDTQIQFRRGILRLFRRKKDVGMEDLVEGARGGYFRSQWSAGYLFSSPWIIGFLVFGGGPLLFSILMSFCDYDALHPAKWIGLVNYKYLFQDEMIPKATINTLFMVIGIPLGLVGSLALALLLNLNIRGVSVWRTIYYLPAIIPAVASFYLWMWLLHPTCGLFNQLLAFAGITGPSWLGAENWSKPSLILMGLWGCGGGILIWLAGLKGISLHYYEAAAIDGASSLQQFRYITLPMITPYIFFHFVVGLIGVFQIFEVALIMTGGGPVNSTLFYVYHLFNNAFRYGHMGYASAMAWGLFIIILILTIIQLKLSRRWVHYESE